MACNEGHDAMARLLLRRGADINKTTKDGFSPLLCATYGSKADVARTLVAAGADVNLADKNGNTPLFGAVARGSLELVTFLLDHAGAKIDAVDTVGASALARADDAPREIINALVTRGLKPTAADSDYITTGSALDAFLNHTLTLDPLEIAVACRLTEDARRILRASSVDRQWECRCRLLELLAAPSPWTVAHAAAGTVDDQVCDTPTTMAPVRAVAKAVAMPWAPARHRLYHRGVRAAVRVVLLAAHRLRYGAVESELDLPIEMWLHILTFVRRAHWAVPAAPPRAAAAQGAAAGAADLDAE